MILISSSIFGLHHSSKNILPGENFYWIKTFEDNISLKTKRNNLDKAKKHMEISATTVRELKQLIDKHKFEETEIALKKIQQNLTIAGEIFHKQINFDHMQISVPSRYQLASTNSIKNRELVELQNYIYSSLKNDTWKINTILNSSCKDLYKILKNEIDDEKMLTEFYAKPCCHIKFFCYPSTMITIITLLQTN